MPEQRQRMRRYDLLRAHHLHHLLLPVRLHDTEFGSSQTPLGVVVTLHDPVTATHEYLIEFGVPHGLDDVRRGHWDFGDSLECFGIKEDQSTGLPVVLHRHSGEHHGVVRTEAAVGLVVPREQVAEHVQRLPVIPQIPYLKGVVVGAAGQVGAQVGEGDAGDLGVRGVSVSQDQGGVDEVPPVVPHLYGAVVTAAGHGVPVPREGARRGVGLEASSLPRLDDVLVLFAVVREPQPQGAVLGAGHELLADGRMPAAAVQRRRVAFGPVTIQLY